MFDGDISVYFSNYVMCTQTIPMSLQSQLSSILQADTIQTNLLKDVQTAIHQMDSNDKDRASSRLKSSLLQLNETYDAKLSEVRELEENLEQLTQLLSQSKSALQANDGQILRKLIDAFNPGGGGRCLISEPPAPNQPPPTTPQKPHRRVVQHHHRPSHSQVLLRGTKWISGRRSAGGNSRSGSHFRGNSAAKRRALVAASTSRSRIADQQRRNQAAMEAIRNRTRKENSSSTSSDSSSSSQESNNAHSRSGQRSRSTSSPAGRRKRESEDGERLYCLCKKGSHGEMIACDNARCEIEWFHFACVDIRVQPKGRWYCPRCRGSNSKVKRSDA